MMRWLFLLLLFPAVSTHGATAEAFYYAGTIGKMNVEMTLWTNDTSNTLTGFYHYVNRRGHFGVYGQRTENGNFFLEEFAIAPERFPPDTTGTFFGKLAATSLEGTWTSAGGKRKLPFRLWRACGMNGVDLLVKEVVHDSALINMHGDTVGGVRCVLETMRVACTDPSIAQKINSSVFHNLSMSGYAEDSTRVYRSPADMDRLACHCVTYSCGLLTGYEAIDSMYRSRDQFWTFDAACNVTWNGNGVLSVSFRYTQNSGGEDASGAVNRSYDLATGDSLTLEDIFIPGYRLALSKAAYRHYSNELAAEDDSDTSMIPPGFSNFYVTPYGIELYYGYTFHNTNPGPADASIPWNEIAIWVDPKGPMGWVK